MIPESGRSAEESVPRAFSDLGELGFPASKVQGFAAQYGQGVFMHEPPRVRLADHRCGSPDGLTEKRAACSYAMSIASQEMDQTVLQEELAKGGRFRAESSKQAGCCDLYGHSHGYQGMEAGRVAPDVIVAFGMCQNHPEATLPHVPEKTFQAFGLH